MRSSAKKNDLEIKDYENSPSQTQFASRSCKMAGDFSPDEYDAQVSLLLPSMPILAKCHKRLPPAPFDTADATHSIVI